MPIPLRPVETECLRGINQNRDNASFDQCYDALNVWGVNGTVEQRPGSVGIVSLLSTPGPQSGSPTTISVYKENPTGTFASVGLGGNFNALPIGARIYFGDPSPYPAVLIQLGPSGGHPGHLNTNKTRAYWEYWNGTNWQVLIVTQADTLVSNSALAFPPIIPLATVIPPPNPLPILSSSPPAYLFWGTSAGDIFYYTFVPPGDWVSTAPNPSLASGKYYIRATLTEANFAASVGFGIPGSMVGQTISGSVVGIARIKLQNSVATVALERTITNTANDTVGILATLTSEAPAQTAYGTYTIDPSITFGGRTSFAATLATGDIYAAYGHKTFRIQTSILGQAGSINYAQVESNPLIVGIGATYDNTVTAQLTTWPSAKVILYHDNQLWAIDDGIVRWSGQDADVIGHNVWPSLQFEYLQGDSTPVIGAISAFNRVWIFKQNAIYASVLQGIDPNFGNVVYTFQRIVSGRGAVSLNAIFPYGDNQVAFLSEDGIWKLDSTGQLKRLSLAPSSHTDAQGNQLMVDRLIKFFDPLSSTAINPSARNGACGIDWATKGVFLLSVPTGSSTVNDTTLVYDYRQDSWWIWRGATPGTNFTPSYWTKDTNQFGVETLYYGDANGYFYQMVDGFPTDHGGALSPYVTTEPIGYKEGTQTTLRRVNLDMTNDAGVVQIDVFANDNFTTARATGKINRFTDWREPVYSNTGGGTPTTQQDDYTHVGTYGVDKYVNSMTRRRMKTFGFSNTVPQKAVTARHVHIKVSNPTPGAHFRLGKIEAIIQTIGRRPG